MVTEKTKLRTIDLTPTWFGVLPLLLETYSNGTDKGRAMALAELKNMATLADAYNASCDPLPVEPAPAPEPEAKPDALADFGKWFAEECNKAGFVNDLRPEASDTLADFDDDLQALMDRDRE